MQASNAEIPRDVCDKDTVDTAVLRNELIGDYEIWKADEKPKCYEVGGPLNDNGQLLMCATSVLCLLWWIKQHPEIGGGSLVRLPS